MQASDAARLPAEPPLLTLPRVGGWRILLGLLQGLLLHLLYHASTTHSWPATQPLAFGPLVLVASFVPLILISGLGHLDRRRLVLWGNPDMGERGRQALRDRFGQAVVL